MQSWLVLAVAAAYVAVLFLIAWWGDRRAERGLPDNPGSWMAGIAYCLTLAVYNTAWSFYGSVGRAATSGLDFLPIYIGPALVLIFGQGLLRKVITLAKAHNATSIADFIAIRYGKNQGVAALVTLTALIAVLPYIALQLKAVAFSFDVLTAPGRGAGAADLPFWQDTAFAVAIAMAVFGIIFGVRHIHASEHHRGLMLAIAFESLVKLAAFSAVGAYIVFGLFDGIGDLLARARADAALRPLLDVDLAHPTWLSNTVIALIAFLCLPQAFHVAVIENGSPRDLRRAAWLYPAYLLLLSLFMVPIAIAGLITLGPSVNPDTFILTLPLAGQALDIGLLAFIGGLSAATGMVIVAAVASSTMLCNDVVMPLLLRSRFLGRHRMTRDVGAALIAIRRICVVLVLMLAYAMHHVVDQRYPLTVIGLLSFVAIAQLGPAFLGGLYWRRASRAGAIIGIAAGIILWVYTLLIPSITPLLPMTAGLINQGPWGIAWLRPQALFGLEGLDPISHATFWSLGANGLMFVLVSLLHRPRLAERLQAEAFVAAAPGQAAPLRVGRAVVRLEDLRGLAARFVGAQRGASAFERYLAARRDRDGPAIGPAGLVDADAIRFTENLLAGAIGAPSARVVIAAALEGHSLSRGAAMAMLDEASEALHFNRKLLEGALESVPQGICVFDAELRVTAWNGRFLDLLDLPRDVVRVGLPLAELIAFNQRRGEYGAGDFASLLTNRDIANQTWPYAYERRRPDGTVLETVYDRMPEGGFISTYTDVTERHRAAEALRLTNESLEQRVRERTEALERAKAEAEHANAGKTRFLAAASHDLMQPLNAARLFLSALQEGEGEARLPDGARLLVGNASAALRSTEHLLGTLLDISSLDGGRVRAEPVDVPVSGLLSQLGLEFSALAQARHLILRVMPCGLHVHTDPNLLRRVLQNLLSNAIRYTPQGRVVLGCRRRGSMLRIEVRDTGIGIPEDRQAEIFEEFRRLDHAAALGEGHGLGLAIVERIARRLGHPIHIRSAPGRGTCIGISVPIAPSPALASPAAPPARDAAPAGSLLVLCLDNDDAILRGMAALLEGWQHRVVPAGDEAAALRLLAGRIPDVALIDYHLDGQDNGLEVLDRLRLRWGRPVQALLITADRSDTTLAEARARGCEVLLKPVKPASLRRFLTRAALQRAGHPDQGTPP